jgi:hypothetical protein
MAKESYYDYNLNYDVSTTSGTNNIKLAEKSKSSRYFEFAEKTCKEMIEMSRKKNADYAGSSDPFANFTQNDNCGGASVEQGFLVRMNDKMARISNFTKTGSLQVKDEAVEDTLKDLANYCLLFLGYLESQKNDSNLA